MMIKKVVIFSLSFGLSLLGPRQAKAEVVSLRATCELKDNLTICSVTSKNMGSQILHINPNYFSLITDDGTSHLYSIETYSDHGYFLSKDVPPEEELKGKLAFEVFGKPEYLVFDNGAGVKAKVSLTRETLKEKKEVEDLKKILSEKEAELAFLKGSLKELGDKLTELMKEEKEEAEGLKTALEEQNLRLKVEVEDLKKILSEKEAELAFLKGSLKELEGKLTEVMEEKEEAQRLKTALEEQNLKLKEKEELLSKCQREKEKAPDKKSKLIPFIFLAGAVALIVSAK